MSAAHNGRRVAAVQSADGFGAGRTESAVAGGTHGAELPDATKKVRGALLDSLRRLPRFVSARRHPRAGVAAKASWHPEDLLGRELAQNAKTWAALQRLGVHEGSEIPLDFFFQ